MTDLGMHLHKLVGISVTVVVWGKLGGRWGDIKGSRRRYGSAFWVTLSHLGRREAAGKLFGAQGAQGAHVTRHLT